MNINQDFAGAIADYYTNYEKIVNRPKAVEVTVRMLLTELLSLSLARPVHVKQLNRNYLITSIESNKNEQYKLKLVQI